LNITEHDASPDRKTLARLRQVSFSLAYNKNPK